MLFPSKFVKIIHVAKYFVQGCRCNIVECIMGEEAVLQNDLISELENIQIVVQWIAIGSKI